MNIILDKRGIAPNYVIERQEGGTRVRNQFTGTTEWLNGSKPFKKALQEAMYIVLRIDADWLASRQKDRLSSKLKRPYNQ